MPKTEGTWPENDIRRAFVEGAEWWQQYISSGFAMYPSDHKLIEKEAEKRYGALPIDKKRSESEIREELKKVKVDANNENFYKEFRNEASTMITILKWMLNEEDKE